MWQKQRGNIYLLKRGFAYMSGKMKSKLLKGFCLLLVLLPAGNGSGQIGRLLKKIPKRVPGLDKILQREPAITTSYNDAVYGIPFLDDFNPTKFKSIDSAERTPEGYYMLDPGLYRFDVESYCMNPATYAPRRGERDLGYLYAPMKGPRADIILKIIRRSFDHPEISQREIQLLLWAIISYTKLSDMSRERQLTATKLLTRQEISEINSQSLQLIPENMLDTAIDKLPTESGRLLKAESRLRGLFTSTHATYEEIESIAVLRGNPPGMEEKELPIRRWSLRREGIFIRYSPDDYKRVGVEIYVPEYFGIKFDEQGRITRISDDEGNHIDATYDNSIEPVIVKGDSALRVVAFNTIRYERSGISDRDEKPGAELNQRGWTFVGVPTGKGSIKTSSNSFPGLKKRYEWATEHRKQLEKLDEQFNPWERMDVVMNLGHFWIALENAFEAENMKDQEWVIEQLEMVKRAWQFCLWLREMHSEEVDQLGNEPIGNDCVHRDSWRQRLAPMLLFLRMNWHNLPGINGDLYSVLEEINQAKIRRRERRKPILMVGVVR